MRLSKGQDNERAMSTEQVKKNRVLSGKATEQSGITVDVNLSILKCALVKSGLAPKVYFSV